jgi:tetratricopeptide (TPR) repeat protein
MPESEIEQGFFTFQSPWRNIFLWNLMEVEREAFLVTPALDLDLLRKIQSIMIARSARKLRIRFLVRFSESDLIDSSVEPDALKILLLLSKDPSSMFEVRFASNLGSTIAVFDGRKAIMASGDLTERSMVHSINHGVLITGNDMVGGLIEDMDDLWGSSLAVPEKDLLSFMEKVRSRLDARKRTIISEGPSGEGFPCLERIDLAEGIPPMGVDRKEPHLDEDKKIVKELLSRAREAVEQNNYDTALFYLDEAQTLKPDDVDLLFERGKVLFSCRNDIEGALECIEKVLETNEDHRDAWTYRGMCYQEKGNDEEALYSYDQATDIDKGHFPVWIKKGIILGRTKGREEDGVKCLEYALEHDPYNEEAWFTKAHVLEQRLNRLDEAVMSYRTLLRINPGHVKGSFRLGLISYKKLKDPKRAEKYFDLVVASDPSHVHAWMFKGEIAETIKGNIDEALSCYDKAREHNPGSIEILRREIDLIVRRGGDPKRTYMLAKDLLKASPNDALGLHIASIGAYRIDGDPQAALKGLDRAIQADPSNLIAIKDKALVLSEGLNSPEDALSLLNIALKRSPDSPDLLSALGDLYFDHLYDPIEAFSSYDRVTALNPSDAQAWYRRGVILTRGLDRHQDALTSLDRATSLKDDHPRAWYEKGRILRSAYSMAEDAIKCYRKSLSIDGNDPEVLTALAVALKDKRNFDESSSLLRKALEVDPAHTDASICLAEVLFAKGDLEAGQQVLNSALAHDPKSDRLWYKKAVAFRSAKEVPKAVECLKRALSFNPGNIDAQNLRADLDTP